MSAPEEPVAYQLWRIANALEVIVQQWQIHNETLQGIETAEYGQWMCCQRGSYYSDTMMRIAMKNYALKPDEVRDLYEQEVQQNPFQPPSP